jgi:hypothetical protein
MGRRKLFGVTRQRDEPARYQGDDHRTGRLTHRFCRLFDKDPRGRWNRIPPWARSHYSSGSRPAPRPAIRLGPGPSCSTLQVSLNRRCGCCREAMRSMKPSKVISRGSKPTEIGGTGASQSSSTRVVATKSFPGSGGRLALSLPTKTGPRQKWVADQSRKQSQLISRPGGREERHNYFLASGGNFLNIFTTALSSFFSFLSGSPESMSAAFPRHTNCFDFTSNMSTTNVPSL